MAERGVSHRATYHGRSVRTIRVVVAGPIVRLRGWLSVWSSDGLKGFRHGLFEPGSIAGPDPFQARARGACGEAEVVARLAGKRDRNEARPQAQRR